MQRQTSQLQLHWADRLHILRSEPDSHNVRVYLNNYLLSISRKNELIKNP